VSIFSRLPPASSTVSVSTRTGRLADLRRPVLARAHTHLELRRGDHLALDRGERGDDEAAAAREGHVGDPEGVDVVEVGLRLAALELGLDRERLAPRLERPAQAPAVGLGDVQGDGLGLDLLARGVEQREPDPVLALLERRDGGREHGALGHLGAQRADRLVLARRELDLHGRLGLGRRRRRPGLLVSAATDDEGEDEHEERCGEPGHGDGG
jgi:hypothetical protein